MGIFVDFQKETEIEELRLGKALDENQLKQIRYNTLMGDGKTMADLMGATEEEIRAAIIGNRNLDGGTGIDPSAAGAGPSPTAPASPER